MLLQFPKPVTVEPLDASPWPVEVQLILSAMEAGGSPGADRRRAQRTRYRVRADLHLSSDPAAAPPWRLYTRDVSARGLGFLTPHRLPLGYGGKVKFAGPDGSAVVAHCTLYRCREAAPGWYEGALSFNREQWALSGAGDD